MSETYYLYHIARPGMSIDQGYIGITKDPDRRFRQHSNSDYPVGRAIRKYSDIVMKLLVIGTENYVLGLEKDLRPHAFIGYNLAAGGGKPLCVPQGGDRNHFYGRHHTEKTKDKLSRGRIGKKHWSSKLANVYDVYTNEIIAENVVLREWCRDNNYSQGSLSLTARNFKRTYRGMYARYIGDQECQ